MGRKRSLGIYARFEKTWSTDYNSFVSLIQGQGTGSAGKSLGTDVVRPTWIDLTSPSQVGLLQTPKFPQPFALPLECLWIFNLTEISATRRNFLHLYFTQVIILLISLSFCKSKTFWFSPNNFEHAEEVFMDFHSKGRESNLDQISST